MTRGTRPHREWVPVEFEPVHGELFQNQLVRVYEARIEPGATTLDHRHDEDTMYVVVRGGTFRSDNSWRQRNVTRTGRSSGLLRTVGWLVRRLTIGWLRIPDGTLLWQPHSDHPLVHRVSASPSNDTALRMLGIELRRRRPPRRIPETTAVRLEYASPRCTSYRITVSPGTTVDIPSESVVTVVHGEITTADGSHHPAGATLWITEDGSLTSRSAEPLLAILTLV
jgi:hypothetical protein